MQFSDTKHGFQFPICQSILGAAGHRYFAQNISQLSLLNFMPNNVTGKTIINVYQMLRKIFLLRTSCSCEEMCAILVLVESIKCSAVVFVPKNAWHSKWEKSKHFSAALTTLCNFHQKERGGENKQKYKLLSRSLLLSKKPTTSSRDHDDAELIMSIMSISKTAPWRNNTSSWSWSPDFFCGQRLPCKSLDLSRLASRFQKEIGRDVLTKSDGIDILTNQIEIRHPLGTEGVTTHVSPYAQLQVQVCNRADFIKSAQFSSMYQLDVWCLEVDL